MKTMSVPTGTYILVVHHNMMGIILILYLLRILYLYLLSTYIILAWGSPKWSIVWGTQKPEMAPIDERSTQTGLFKNTRSSSNPLKEGSEAYVVARQGKAIFMPFLR